jgi:hypothetical protein
MALIAAPLETIVSGCAHAANTVDLDDALTLPVLRVERKWTPAPRPPL